MIGIALNHSNFLAKTVSACGRVRAYQETYPNLRLLHHSDISMVLKTEPSWMWNAVMEFFLLRLDYYYDKTFEVFSDSTTEEEQRCLWLASSDAPIMKRPDGNPEYRPDNFQSFHGLYHRLD